MKNIRNELEQRKQQSLYRSRKQIQSPQGREIMLNGRRVLNFCSNDYLGLAAHPAIKQAFIDAASQYGVGSGSAHLVNGHSDLHHKLEEQLAEFTGYPRALLFSTGYMANLGVAQSLCGKNDTIIQDRLNHASLLDAANISGSRLKRYLHCDYTSLQKKLDNIDSGELLVSSDAVFSMDGDQADIKAMAQLCQSKQAWLMLDDAHGFGVLGNNGQGSLNHQNISNENVPIYMATLGKAIGTAGAFVAGSQDLIEYLIQTARSYIYTTAMPPAIAAASSASLKLLIKENWRQQALNENISHFKSLAKQSGLTCPASDTAIQPVIIGDAQKTWEISQQLLNTGLHVAAIRPPTVPVNTARLRVTLRADHHRGDIERLVAGIVEAGKDVVSHRSKD